MPVLKEAPLERERAAAPAVGDALRALRPRQWTKNLLLLAGLIFAAKLADSHRWLEAAVGVAAYCAASSAAYLVNDVRDAEADRYHPIKRRRPIAAAEVSPQLALGASTVLAIVAICLGFTLGFEFLGLLAAFLCLQAAYSLWLKRLVVADVLVIAALFVLRAAAGAAAVDVRISLWLLLCTALLALFLGLAKRRAELVLVETAGAPRRHVLHVYTRRNLDAALASVGMLALVSYGSYTAVGARTAWMSATVPFVAFGIGRYLHLVHRSDLGEEPEQIFLRDVPILACVTIWAVLSGVLLTFA